MRWLNLICGFLIVVLVLFSAPVHAQQKPWTPQQIVKMLNGDVPPKRVAELVHERGIDFQVSPEIESELRQAGADDELISTLHEIAPQPVAPASLQPAALAFESTPGGAQVYVDDEPVGKTSAEGRLRLSQVQPGSHRIRVELDGYKDSERTVELTNGQSAEVTVRLEAKKPLAISAGGKSISLPAGTEQAETFHLTRWGGIWGDLKISHGQIEWREIGNGIGHHVENFAASCQDISEVKRNRSGIQAFHIRLKTGKNYNLWTGDEKVDPGPVLQAIANACSP